MHNNNEIRLMAVWLQEVKMLLSRETDFSRVQLFIKTAGPSPHLPDWEHPLKTARTIL